MDSRRVVQKPDCEFVALSYVWGSRPASPSYVERATCENIKGLSSTGLGELPRTIEDAISVCKYLNKKYLWVDRYCIVQDDEENKHSQISSMAAIFTASDFTIIACSGASVESGILGVREKLQERKRFSFKDVEVTDAPPAMRFVTESVWNSRAWTYQEAVLARKRLFLTPAGAFFWCESRIRGIDSSQRKWYNFFTDVHMYSNTLFEDYSRHIQHYTSRKLSYDDDIYDAFEGVAHALYGHEHSFHFGIPELEFDQGLLWTCNEFSCLDCESCEHDGRKNSKPDETHQANMENRDNGNFINLLDSNSCSGKDRYLRFCKRTTPSWSWASLEWPVHFVGFDHFTITLVKWIIYKQDKLEIRPTAINATNESGLWRYQGAAWRIWVPPEDPQLNFALAIRERCFEAEIECYIPMEENFERLRERFAEKWPKYINAYDEIPEISPKKTLQSDGVLFTRAQSAFFYVDSYWIKDSEGLTIGYVSLNPRLHHIQAVASHNLSMEFIALSISSYPVPRPEIHFKRLNPPSWFYWEIPKEQYREMTYFDCEDTPLLPVPVVNVMLICWKGDFAQRVAVGLIVLKQWAKAERKFKDVWLK